MWIVNSPLEPSQQSDDCFGCVSNSQIVKGTHENKFRERKV
jgi:hypothetical protein